MLRCVISFFPSPFLPARASDLPFRVLSRARCVKSWFCAREEARNGPDSHFRFLATQKCKYAYATLVHYIRATSYIIPRHFHRVERNREHESLNGINRDAGKSDKNRAFNFR